MDRNSKKKEKAEVAETLSQGKEQFEGDQSSQLSERSTSSPATQTPTASPVLKGTVHCGITGNTYCFWFDVSPHPTLQFFYKKFGF